MYPFHNRLFFLALGTVALAANVGCSGDQKGATTFERVGAEIGHVDGENADNAAPKAKQPAIQQAQAGEKIQRKIVYTAHIRLFTEDLDAKSKKLTELLEQYKGYVQAYDIQGTTGQQRTATWTLRVPVKSFDVLRDAVLNLGEPQQNSVRSQERTEEYYDLLARLKNARKYEQSVLKLLDEDTKDVKAKKDILKELDHARERVEVLEGKMRLLDDLTSLSTLHITMIERRDYQPEQSPSFDVTVGRTFQDSIDAMIQFGKGAVLVTVAVGPWLFVLAIVVVPLWFLLRRGRRVTGN